MRRLSPAALAALVASSGFGLDGITLPGPFERADRRRRRTRTRGRRSSRDRSRPPYNRAQEQARRRRQIEAGMLREENGLRRGAPWADE